MSDDYDVPCIAEPKCTIDGVWMDRVTHDQRQAELAALWQENVTLRRLAQTAVDGLRRGMGHYNAMQELAIYLDAHPQEEPHV